MMKIILLLLVFIFQINAFAQSATEVYYLSGTDKDHPVRWAFFCTEGRRSGQWDSIDVPSNWELKGFGNYNYGIDLYTPDKIPVHKEKGIYRHTFRLPETWKGRRIFIVFGGAMTDTEVKINGKPAGPVHQGGFYEFRYEIGKLLRPGLNTLEATVSKESANESVNLAERRADYWVFGGIYRPVFLESKPAEHIERTSVDARADGSFSVNVYLNGLKKATQVEAIITDLAGIPLDKPFSAPVSAKTNMVPLNTQVESPKLWSPEFPNLYRFVVRLKQNDLVIHEVSSRFGFRTVELRLSDGIYLNGERMMFKGVCRHSFWPSSGRCMSKELSITDVKLMKEMNMNAVRMSHYPPDSHFLDVCDSLGLMVLDELAGWQQPYYDTQVGKLLVAEMLKRDVNHPCIVVWDNGNEGGSNPELDKEFHLYDPQKRPVIHPWANHNGINTEHYRNYNYGLASHWHGNEVFFPTEFLHGLYDGGHGAGLDDFWNLMLASPLSAGGFLWVFADEAVVRTDREGQLDSDGNHAPDGIVGPYREKEGSFFTIQEIWSPVQIVKKYITPDFDSRLLVENRYHFTNLNQCKFRMELLRFPSPFDKSVEAKVLFSKDIVSPDVAPQLKGFLHLPLPASWREAHALVITVTDPHGQIVNRWTRPISQRAEIADWLVDETATSAIKASETDAVIELKTGSLSLTFDKNNGFLRTVNTLAGPVSLSNGPMLIDAKAKLSSLKHKATGDKYVIEAEYDGDDKYTFTWTLLPGGWLKLDYAYIQWGERPYAGISFDYPEEKVVSLTWLGEGPYRVWKNRMKGVDFGCWKKLYNNTVTGESFDYPEFKGYHSNFYWSTVETSEGAFTVVNASDEDLFLRMLTPENPKGAYNENTSPEFPDGDISFMHGINPIGTKFKAPGQIGPQGGPHTYWPNNKHEWLTGSLYFYFGN